MLGEDLLMFGNGKEDLVKKNTNTFLSITQQRHTQTSTMMLRHTQTSTNVKSWITYWRYQVLIPLQGDINLFHQTKQTKELGTVTEKENRFSLKSLPSRGMITLQHSHIMTYYTELKDNLCYNFKWQSSMRDRGGAANCAFWTFQFDTYLQLVTDAQRHTLSSWWRGWGCLNKCSMWRGSGHMEGNHHAPMNRLPSYTFLFLSA